jgi:carboxypeptidase C (cathepsin A)
MARTIVAFPLAFCLFATCLAAPVLADDPGTEKKSEQAARGLPAEVATTHTVTLGGEKISFVGRAGAIQLNDAQSGAPQASVAFVSYERVDADRNARPVAFVFNGGPGAASAWLGLGAISPWRLHLGANAPSPSSSPSVVDNGESWLVFADLVFIDPPGSGYSKILVEGAEQRKRFHSVEGDVDALAVVVRKWLTAHRRLASPKYLVGESYGGFRVAKLLRALRDRENVGVDGLVLVSPTLDFAWLDASRNLLVFSTYLPSFAAIARSAKDRGELVDVETYASGEYVSDLLKGVKDVDALSRLSANVARLTGLDRETVARLAGRVDARTFSRERRRAQKQIISIYDGEIAGFDPAPFTPDSDWADPVLDSLRAPLGAAMTFVTAEKLQWPIGDARYEILNDRVAHEWDYGYSGRGGAEAISDLERALALDPRLKVLVVHGFADLVTPYFATKLLLDQMPSYGDSPRVRLVLLPGGHMPYLRDESRRMLRDAARVTIMGK